jgi:hypothetical protein
MNILSYAHNKSILMPLIIYICIFAFYNIWKLQFGEIGVAV